MVPLVPVWGHQYHIPGLMPHKGSSATHMGALVPRIIFEAHKMSSVIPTQRYMGKKPIHHTA